MITNKQRQFLHKLLIGETCKEDNPKKYSRTMIQIQKQIDRCFINLLWLVSNYPDILTDEQKEFDDSELERYRRFKALCYVVSQLNPMTELEEIGLTDILRKLGNLYPKYYFEITLKDKDR